MNYHTKFRKNSYSGSKVTHTHTHTHLSYGLPFFSSLQWKKRVKNEDKQLSYILRHIAMKVIQI